MAFTLQIRKKGFFGNKNVDLKLILKNCGLKYGSSNEFYILQEVMLGLFKYRTFPSPFLFFERALNTSYFLFVWRFPPDVSLCDFFSISCTSCRMEMRLNGWV